MRFDTVEVVRNWLEKNYIPKGLYDKNLPLQIENYRVVSLHTQGIMPKYTLNNCTFTPPSWQKEYDVIFDRYIFTLYPRAAKEMQEFYRSIFAPLTKSLFQERIKEIRTSIFQTSTYQIGYLNDDVELYLNEGNFNGLPFSNWVQQLVLPFMMEDASGSIIAIPSSLKSETVQSISEEGTLMMEKVDFQRNDIEFKLVNCTNKINNSMFIIDGALFISEEVLKKTKDGFVKAWQVTIARKGEQTMTYTYPFNPVYSFAGDSNIDNSDSPLTGAALIGFDYLSQHVETKTAYGTLLPVSYEVAESCGTCNGEGVVNGVVCHTCNGKQRTYNSGRVINVPLEHSMMSGNSFSAANIAGFVSPSVEYLRNLSERTKEQREQVKDALYTLASGVNQSGISKELDLQAGYKATAEISNKLNPLIKWLLSFVGYNITGVYDPSLAVYVPNTQYTLTSKEDSLKNFEDIRKAGMPRIAVENALRQYIYASGNDDVTAKILSFLLWYDPLFVTDPAQNEKGVLIGIVSRSAFEKSTQAQFWVDRFIYEQTRDKFMSSSFDIIGAFIDENIVYSDIPKPL